MNITSFFASAPRIGRLLATAAAVFAMGLLNPPAVQMAQAATTTTVAVDQQPLVLRQQVPPNITLMLDDSGSMSWNFMPDWSYLSNNSNNNAVIDASNNGVYYNPAVVYTPPPQVSGTSNTSYTDLTAVPYNGFSSSPPTVNLYTYDGSNDYYDCGGVCSGSAITYNASTQHNVTTTGTYSQTVTGSSACQYQANSHTSYTNYSYTSSNKKCSFNYSDTTQVTVNFFQYSTGAAAGPYTVYYVTADAADCQYHPTPSSSGTYGGCVGASDTSGTAAPAKDTAGNTLAAQTNIANWFAYYHTRILMAKSGLMTAFDKLNPSYRLGFGSINDNNSDALSNTYGTSHIIQQVSPFDTACAANPKTCTPGGSGTTRAGFWGWAAGESPGSSTPLRGALDSVGQYYQSSQPWTTLSTDPGYGQTNPPSNIACRQAYTILTTDGFWNDSYSGAGDADGTAGSKITGPNSQSYQYSPVQPYTDSLISTTTSNYGATCSSRSATLDTSTGNCNWTSITYKQTKNGSSTTKYGASYSCSNSPYNGYYSCSSNSGSYNGCNSGDTWNSSLLQCVNTQTTGTSYSNTLADVAMYYWNQDLQTGIDNEVPPSTADPAFWQHMTTFTIGLGFTPTGITPTGTTVGQIFDWAQGGTAISGFSWPKPASNSINNIADLAHAGVNGHGGFFSATDPTSFVNGLTTALNRASDRVGTGASLAANSTQLQTGTAVFQANYFTGNWKGDMKELPVNANNGTIATAPKWSAGAQLKNSVCTAVTDSSGNPTGVITCDNRNIQTYNPATGTFVAFKNSVSGTTTTPPALSTAQLTTLSTVAGATVSSADVVDYLRGNSTLEQKYKGSFRSRDWPLGDIVDSQPVYEGAPDPNAFINTQFPGYTSDPSNTSCTGCSPFQDWAIGTTDSNGNFTASAASQRAGVAWVAGNDGMLHGFNASTGNEIYAYLPGALMVNSTDPVTGNSNPLANLADPAYGSTTKPHQYYNDGELTVVDAYVKLTQSGDTSAQWHTVLIGTTGRGPARAVYALDVTDPTNVTPLWERYAGDSSSLDSNSGYIGQMVGKPVVAQTSGDGTAAGSWAVLIGNGYNSPKATAALLQFDLATGTLSVHTTTDTSDGLAAPLVWMDYPSSFISDYAYAGDLSGNVWSFQLASVTTDKKTGNNTFTATPTAAGVKLFTATDSTGKAQPITAGLWAARVPSTAAINPNSVWLFFGTGKYLTQTDVNDQSVQSWYGIIAQTTAGNGPVSAFTRTDSKMVQRSIIAEQAASSSQLAVRAVTQPNATTDPYSANDMTGKKGWVMDLESPNSSGVANSVAQGERMVAPNQLQGNLLIGTTRIPKPTGDIKDPCNPAGSGWIMAVNPFSGTGPISNFFDTNNDGSINGGDTITLPDGTQVPAAGVGFTSLPNAPIFIGGDMFLSFDNSSTASLPTAASSGGYSRVSWQELITQ